MGAQMLGVIAAAKYEVSDHNCKLVTPPSDGKRPGPAASQFFMTRHFDLLKMVRIFLTL